MPSDPRYHYLDAVRAFALLLGIVFHASLSFTPVFIGWAVMDVSTSALVLPFITVSHSFRMELFFLISGFFSHMVFHRAGAVSFLQSRLQRIVLPFLLGWFVLKPLLVSGWIMGFASLSGPVDIRAGLMGGLESFQTLPSGIFTGTHLWFLYYLLLTTGLTLLLRQLLGSVPGLREWLTARVDRVLASVIRRNLTPWLLAVPTAALILRMQTWGMDTPDKSLVPHVPVLLLYAGCFLLGWALHRQSDLLNRMASLSWVQLALAGVSTAATLWLATWQFQPAHPAFQVARIAYAVSYALMMWSLIGVTLGFFRRFVDRPHPVIRYIADASYWLYLIHLPVVVWLQIAFAELSLPWSLKWLMICTLTVGIGLVTYDLFVRQTWVGQLLNGRKRDRICFSGPRAVAVRS